MEHSNDFINARAMRLAVLAALVCVSVIGLLSKRHHDRIRAEREDGAMQETPDSVLIPKTRDDSLDVFVKDLLDYLKDELENTDKQ